MKLVEPSEEVKNAYLTKSKLEEAISMAYYSMYYSLLALLFKVGIKSENHTASIILMKLLFGLDNSEIMKAKKERIDKQYYVDFEIAESDVEELIKIAEDFNARLYDLSEKLSRSEIEEARRKFGDLFGKNQN